jgi:hypothetical protein
VGIEHFHFVFPGLFWTVDVTSRDIAPACQGEAGRLLRDGAGNLAVHATVTFTMIGVEKAK